MLKYLHVLLVLLTTFPFVSNAGPHAAVQDDYTPCFLEDEITLAINERNSFFLSFTADSAGVDVRTWSETERAAALETLATSQFTIESWPQFLYGILLNQSGEIAAENYFGKALRAAAESPAVLWLLFVEFNRYNLSSFSKTTLDELEKSLFLYGATAATIISDHLFTFGIEAIHRGNKSGALWYFTQAHRFNRFETKSIHERLKLSLPFQLTALYDALLEYATAATSSWQVQVEFLASLYNFIRTIGIFFIVIIITTLCLKHFPTALHSIGHLFPKSTPVELRTIFVSLIIFSTLSFGFLPFLWLCSLLLWKHLSKKESVLFTVILAMIVLSPLDSYIRAQFNSAMVTEGDLKRLSSAIHENGDITSGGGSSYPSHLERAILSLKYGDFTSASQQLRQIDQSIVNDPVLDNIRGITHYFLDDIDSATSYFNKVLSYDQNNYYAYFNLSRCALRLNNASGAIDYLKSAATLHPSLINSFVQKNDSYFDTLVPPMREVIFPDYSIKQFWQRFFTTFNIDSNAFKAYWGISFLGLSPIISGCIFLGLTCILIVFGIGKGSEKKIKRLFNCKYCGKIICRRCTTGILCSTCTGKMDAVAETKRKEQMRNTLITSKRLRTTVSGALLNMLVPGAGTLYGTFQTLPSAVIPLVVSSFFYTLWSYFLMHLSSGHATPNEFVLFIVPLAIFHLYAFWNFSPTFFKYGKNLLLHTPSSGAS